VHKHNVRRRRKVEGNVGETVRIASIVQKGVSTGRSSYVEMRALARQTSQNVRSKVRAIRAIDNTGADELLKRLALEIGDGYTHVLTPNGAIRQESLDALLALDADIATCLGIIESELNDKKEPKGFSTLDELVKERKKLVDDLRA
jgi:hypothetical protein